MARSDQDDLRRRKSLREPKRRFILYCEGQNTEPDYFRAVQKSLKNSLVSVTPIGASGVPMTIAEAAIKRAETEKLGKFSRTNKNEFAKSDQIWAIFDKDDHPNYDEAIKLCESKGIKIARSNPCFELWLILHFEDFNKPDGREAVQKHLEDKRHLPDYDSSKGKTCDMAKLMDKMQGAEERAERGLNNRKAEGDILNAPSTTVHHLTKEIRAAHEASKPQKAP